MKPAREKAEKVVNKFLGEFFIYLYERERIGVEEKIESLILQDRKELVEEICDLLESSRKLYLQNAHACQTQNLSPSRIAMSLITQIRKRFGGEDD